MNLFNFYPVNGEPFPIAVEITKDISVLGQLSREVGLTIVGNIPATYMPGGLIVGTEFGSTPTYYDTRQPFAAQDLKHLTPWEVTEVNDNELKVQPVGIGWNGLKLKTKAFTVGALEQVTPARKHFNQLKHREGSPLDGIAVSYFVPNRLTYAPTVASVSGTDVKQEAPETSWGYDDFTKHAQKILTGAHYETSFKNGVIQIALTGDSVSISQTTITPGESSKLGSAGSLYAGELVQIIDANADQYKGQNLDDVPGFVLLWYTAGGTQLATISATFDPDASTLDGSAVLWQSAGIPASVLRNYHQSKTDVASLVESYTNDKTQVANWLRGRVKLSKQILNYIYTETDFGTLVPVTGGQPIAKDYTRPNSWLTRGSLFPGY